MQYRVAMVMVSAALALSACDRVANSTKSVQTVTYRAFNDTKSSWREFFTYHPPIPEALPQTRYCYQMQSDIVCYDSQQTALTSKLTGFQDGETVSWVQPGGGSLGASGGEPVALRPIPPQVTTNPTLSINDFLPELDFKRLSFMRSPTSAAAPAGEGKIDVSNLPPINSVAKVGEKIH